MTVLIFLLQIKTPNSKEEPFSEEIVSSIRRYSTQEWVSSQFRDGKSENTERNIFNINERTPGTRAIASLMEKLFHALARKTLNQNFKIADNSSSQLDKTSKIEKEENRTRMLSDDTSEGAIQLAKVEKNSPRHIVLSELSRQWLIVNQQLYGIRGLFIEFARFRYYFSLTYCPPKL